MVLAGINRALVSVAGRLPIGLPNDVPHLGGTCPSQQWQCRISIIAGRWAVERVPAQSGVVRSYFVPCPAPWERLAGAAAYKKIRPPLALVTSQSSPTSVSTTQHKVSCLRSCTHGSHRHARIHKQCFSPNPAHRRRSMLTLTRADAHSLLCAVATPSTSSARAIHSRALP